MGKNADGAWYARVQNFKGEKTEIPYDRLDPASQQILKEIWQLKFTIAKAAAPLISHEQADAAKSDKELAQKAKKRNAALSAPFGPPDKDGYRLWTNLLGGTFVAKVEGHGFAETKISWQHGKVYADGKEYSTLTDWQRAYLDWQARTNEPPYKDIVDFAKHMKPQPKNAKNGRTISTSQGDTVSCGAVIFSFKNGRQFCYPLGAMRGSGKTDSDKMILDAEFLLGGYLKWREKMDAEHAARVQQFLFGGGYDALSDQVRRERAEVERKDADRKLSEQEKNTAERVTKLEQKTRDDQRRQQEERERQADHDRRDAENKRNAEAVRKSNEAVERANREAHERIERQAREAAERARSGN